MVRLYVHACHCQDSHMTCRRRTRPNTIPSATATVSMYQRTDPTTFPKKIPIVRSVVQVYSRIGTKRKKCLWFRNTMIIEDFQEKKCSYLFSISTEKYRLTLCGKFNSEDLLPPFQHIRGFSSRETTLTRYILKNINTYSI